MKTKRRVTMKDIAQQTGFSINTVSLALKGREEVTEETRNIILKAADEMGYIGNAIASSMRSGNTGNIAVIIGDVANPHFSRIIKGFVNHLSRHQYNAVIYNTEERKDYEKNSIRSAIRQNVDGILICPVCRDDENLDMIVDAKIPFVAFGGTNKNPEINTVALNDVKGGYLAAKYLLSRGHRDLLFVNAPDYVLSSKERLEGFKQALFEYDVPFNPDNVVVFTMNGDDMDWQSVKYKLCHQLSYTGVVAFSDIIAMRLIKLFQSDAFKDKRIEQTDIVGFDNALETFPVPLNLSSVSYADIDIAVAVPQVLLDILQGDETEPKHIMLDVKLYAREG